MKKLLFILILLFSCDTDSNPVSTESELTLMSMEQNTINPGDLPPKIIYTTRSHGWSTTKLKDLITRQTIEQNPDILAEKKND